MSAGLGGGHPEGQDCEEITGDNVRVEVRGGPVQVGHHVGDQVQEEEPGGTVQGGHAHMDMGGGGGQPGGQVRGDQGEVDGNGDPGPVRNRRASFHCSVYEYKISHYWKMESLLLTQDVWKPSSCQLAILSKFYSKLDVPSTGLTQM